MARSYQNKPEHAKWYKLKVWCHVPTGLRWQCLLKALFTCKQCGWQARASETSNLICDHIKPHRGDYNLFLNPDNLQCLCKPCHDREKQSEEKLGYSRRLREDGWPIDANHPVNGGTPDVRPSYLKPMAHPSWFRPVQVPLIIVCGPPASGKTTYVRNSMVDGDKVIELDVIAKEAFGKPIRLLPTKNRLDCLRIRNDKLALLMRKQHTMPIGSTWLIATEPLAEARQWWFDTVKPQSIIIIATPFDECMRRASLDEEKAKRRGQGVGISIADWWKAYKPRHGETVIRP